MSIATDVVPPHSSPDIIHPSSSTVKYPRPSRRITL